LKGLLHVKRGNPEVVCPANSYEADAGSRGKFDSLFHGPRSDDRAKTVVSVHKSGGSVRSDYARHRAGIHCIRADALGIDGKANHSVRIYTAQIGQDQAVADFSRVCARYMQFFQYCTTELVQVFCAVALWQGH
jgi:hypothetical protein